MIDNSNIDRELLDLALTLSSNEYQEDMFTEECAEAIVELGKAIVAVNHYRRGRIDKHKLAEEIADTFIMCHKLAAIVGLPLVDQQVKNKMERLRTKLVERLKGKLELNKS